MKEYKIYIYAESVIGTLMFGQSKTNPDKMARQLNELAKEGWRVITMQKETRRMLMISSREAFVFVLERDRRPVPQGAN